MHGRKEAAVREAVEFVEGCRSGEAKVEGIVADISSLRGMNELCDEVLARTDRLDCLLNNAGERRRAARGLRVIAAEGLDCRLVSLLVCLFFDGCECQYAAQPGESKRLLVVPRAHL